MKRLFIILLSIALMLCSCSEECTEHTDSDGNLACDECGKYLSASAEVCTSHTDENHDGKCDTDGCRISLEVFHFDKDHNGDCDGLYCEESFPVTHSDANHDGKCDEPACSCALAVNHVDNNHDGACDLAACGAMLTLLHPDENCDGVCDVSGCGKAFEIVHRDTDKDGFCDGCGADSITFIGIDLISKGNANFAFVIPSNTNGTLMMAVDGLIAKLERLGYSPEILKDNKSTISDKTEILIGEIKSRGEKYSFSQKYLGKEGYAVKELDGKILIMGGSQDSLLTAIKHFTEVTLGITEATERLDNVTFMKSDSFEKIQDGYAVESIKLGSLDISGAVIAYDNTFTENRRLAVIIQDMLYTDAGIWLPIKDAGDLTDEKRLLISAKEKSGGEGFVIVTDALGIEIISEFPHKTVETGEAYFKELLSSGDSEVIITDTQINVRDVSYEDFGAIGDGIADDYEAIKETHEYANKYGHTVVAGKGATYYIGPIPAAITIQTDVNWKGATFIIDDREIFSSDSAKDVSIFRVASNEGGVGFTEKSEEIIRINASGGLSLQTDKIDLGLGYPALLIITNSYHKNYIRYGANQNSGASQKEIVIIDESGIIDKDTPIAFDYERVTSISAIRIDDKPITLSGGTFITRANQAESDYKYYARNIVISRSNTTVKGLTYKITDEREGKYGGDPYGAFLSVTNANNVLITDCILSAHKTYYAVGSGGSEVGMGSYGISASTSNNVVWQRCLQSNFYAADGVTPLVGYWGIMSSSYSKNLTYRDSTLSRFDAHAGVYNAQIINSSVVHFRIVGSGTLTLSDSHIYNNLLIGLREDYGAFWHGDIVIENVTMHNTGDVNLINGAWYHHNFGYPTAHPTNITIDNLVLERDAKINLFTNAFIEQTSLILKEKWEIPVLDADGNPTGETETVDNLNPTKPTERVIIRNNKNGYEFVLPDKNEYPFFKNTEFIIED